MHLLEGVTTDKVHSGHAATSHAGRAMQGRLAMHCYMQTLDLVLDLMRSYNGQK